MDVIIGIDGGGTKTNCIIADINGNVLLRLSGGPCNLLIAGEKAVAELLFELISSCITELKIDFSNIRSILIGCKGAGRVEDAERLKNELVVLAAKNHININSLYVTSDAAIALEGALSGKPGCILISGTGSILYGKDEEGKIYRVGGFGKLIGDEGSAFSIGRKGLTAIAREFDGRGSTTQLTSLLKEKYNIDSQDKLIAEVYSNSMDIAAITIIVIQAAENEDIVSREILNEECSELLLHLRAMKQKLKVNEFDLCLLGGNLNSDNYFSRLLISKIKSELSFVRLKMSDFPPAMGAVLMARKIMTA